MHPVVVYDREARIVFANHVAAAGLGHPASSLPGRSFAEFYPHRLGWAPASFEAALDADRPIIHEQTFVVDGVERTYLSVVQILARADAEQPLFAVNSYDVTELRAAEQNAAVHLRLLDCVEQAVIATDPDGRLTFWNSCAERLYGWSKDEAIGQNIRDLTVTPTLADFSEAIMERLSRGGSWSGEYEARRKDGSTFPAAVTLSPITSEDGERLGLVGVSTDLTARKRMERDLQRAQNLESLSHLAGGIAHDFNNIMTSVIGNLSLLEGLLDGASAEAREVAREAHTAAERTRGLANQLLTFAKGGEPARKPTDIVELISGAARAGLRESSCSLELDLDADLTTLEVDGSQIWQVVENLVRNAAESMAANPGRVRVAAGLVQPEATVAPSEARLEIKVEDQGVGMRADVLERVFDPYFSTKPAGQGLGLAVAHSIVVRHRGEIRLESTPGVGTRFSVSIPGVRPPPGAAGSTEAERPPLFGGGRALVMDGDGSVHAALRPLLARVGYTYVASQEGDEALEAYSRALRGGRRFDLMFTALTIPGARGGREIIEGLLEVDPSAYVVHLCDRVHASLTESGFADRLCKPIRAEDLYQVLRRFEAH